MRLKSKLKACFLLSIFFIINSEAAPTAVKAPFAKRKSKPTLEQPQDDLRSMQEKYKSVTALAADFTQSQTNTALGTTRVSTGHIFIRRPNKFRWETLDPDPSILVSNGKKVWYYTPPFRKDEHGQIMVKKAADVQSQLAVDLLAGQSDFKKDFKIKRLASERYHLTPLKPAGDVEHIELHIEKPTNLVYKIILFTTTGNMTELALKNVTLSPQLSDAMFDFVVPENTDEIK